MGARILTVFSNHLKQSISVIICYDVLVRTSWHEAVGPLLNNPPRAMAAPVARSCEPERRKAYDADLRWRGIFSIIVGGATTDEVAVRCGVCRKTVLNWWDIFIQTGHVDPRRRAAPPVEQTIDELTMTYIISILEMNPTLRLDELCTKIREVTGNEVSISTMCRQLHHIGWSRKAVQLVAKQRCSTCRVTFVAEVMLAFPSHVFVWVDECGCQCKDCYRRKGWSAAGVRPVHVQPYRPRGPNLSTIAAVATDGLVAVRATNQHVNGDEFFRFCLEDLLPECSPLDDTFPRRSVVVMDNAAFHKVQPVRQLFHDAGVLLIFQPAYSPDFNVAEYLFGYVKSQLRKNADDLQIGEQPLEMLTQVVLHEFRSVPAHHCAAWARHCGYE